MRLAATCSNGSPAVANSTRPGAVLRHFGCQHCLKVLGAQRRNRRRLLTCRAASSGDTGSADAGSSIPDTLPVAPADSDWRAFRARLVSASNSSSSTQGTEAASDAGWAHPLPRPELGCLLLANPLMFLTSQTYFHMSVILVWAHDERGSAGLILNKPTEHRVGRLSKAADFLTPEFDRAQLYLGGDVGAETLHLLHGIPGMPSSSCNEVFPGVYLGGFEAAKRGIAEGRHSVDQFKVLTRYAGWGPGQLEAECARGVWLPVSASKDAVLQLGASLGAGDDHWHHVAQLAGGDLAALSREVKGVADPEIQRAARGRYESEQEEESQRAAGGGYAPSKDEEEREPGQPAPSAQLQQYQQRRRGRLPETDYKDGAGI